MVKWVTMTTRSYRPTSKFCRKPYLFPWSECGNRWSWNNQANPDEDESLASFAKTLKAFFACHSTEDDRHELVSIICYVQKPENMKVQPFFYRLKELNDYVNWLPGDKPALTEAQLNLAFYNRMPSCWRV
jgi:hypothetical protein